MGKALTPRSGFWRELWAAFGGPTSYARYLANTDTPPSPVGETSPAGSQTDLQAVQHLAAQVREMAMHGVGRPVYFTVRAQAAQDGSLEIRIVGAGEAGEPAGGTEWRPAARAVVTAAVPRGDLDQPADAETTA